MTDLMLCAGMTERERAGVGQRERTWRAPRRDTRGKRGYDGVAPAGMTERERAGVGRRERTWCAPRRDTRGEREYDGVAPAGMTELLPRYDGSICAGVVEEAGEEGPRVEQELQARPEQAMC